ncbi:MAG: SOS response-associated peptidase [Rhodomicrobiaceae bacterium]
MCSKFSIKSHPETVKNHFKYLNPAEFPPLDNIRPTDPIMIIREVNANKRELALVRWGLIPHWVKNPDDFNLIINARAETLMEKPSFRTSVAHKRCLVPADGFYEWSGPKGNRTPHHITLTQDKSTSAPETPQKAPLMAFAGLWDHWLGAEGSEFESAAIITMAANNQISQLHNRMPAIIMPEDFDDWLDVKNVNSKEALKLLKPAPDGHFSIANLTPKPKEKKKPAPSQGELF